MSNEFYQPGEQRAAKVGDLFAAIAPRYDLINDLQSFGLHRRWKRLLLRMADIKPGERALDLCCGTGDIAFALNAAGADVVGVDFSPAMLAVAQERAKNGGYGGAGAHLDTGLDSLAPRRAGRGVLAEETRASSPRPSPPSGDEREKAGTVSRSGAGSGRLQFLCGDAMNVPFADNSFDAVTIGYGLRNLSSWERGLEEMERVARPGGRLLVLDFGKPENALWRGIYFAGLKFLVPLFGKIFCRNAAAYAYIYESLRDYPAQRGVAAKMEALGCEDVQVRQLLGGAMSIHFGRVRKES